MRRSAETPLRLKYNGLGREVFWSAPAERERRRRFRRARRRRKGCACSFQSGVALRLPPQSKTLARFPAMIVFREAFGVRRLQRRCRVGGEAGKVDVSHADEKRC